MNLLMTLLVMMGMLACHVMENEGEDKFAIRKKAKVYYHAHYLFGHQDYDSVETAVRIELQSGKPVSVEVKDFSAAAVGNAVEKAELSADGNDFKGTTSGDMGGEYVVKLDADDVCCGAINFTPTADSSATFTSTKLSDITAEQWQELLDKHYYYAEYLFSHADYEDVEVALRIEITAGNPAKMEIKDLTPPADKAVEELTLSSAGDDFTGTSSGDEGGKYVVKLAADDVCCGAINFTPTADSSVTFAGTKQESLTSVQWEELIEGAQASAGEQESTQASTGGDTGQVTLTPADLGTKKVGKLFHIDVSGKDVNTLKSYDIVIEAYDSSGNKLTKALATWRGGIYHPRRHFDSNSGRVIDLFFTQEAEGKVSKLVASIDGNKIGELAVKVSSADKPSDLYQTRMYDGGGGTVTYSYSASEREKYGIDDSNKDEIKNFYWYLVNASGGIVNSGGASAIKVGHSGYTYLQEDEYTTNTWLQIWNAQEGKYIYISCQSGHQVFVQIVGTKGESDVHQYNCP